MGSWSYGSDAFLVGKGVTWRRSEQLTTCDNGSSILLNFEVTYSFEAERWLATLTATLVACDASCLLNLAAYTEDHVIPSPTPEPPAVKLALLDGLLEQTRGMIAAIAAHREADAL